MTITERNQQLYELRKRLDQKKLEMSWIETQIMAVNSQYDREHRPDLFEEMFGTSWQGGTQVVAMPPPIPYIKRVKQTQHQMRKIEQQMNSAISNCKDWRSANTEVVNCNGESFVYLHGNHIATVGDDFVKIFDGGWQSNTTKSRLNAILHEFAYGVGVFQKNWEWFVCNNNKTEDFTNGMEIAF